jgi:hypothetical protein
MKSRLPRIAATLALTLLLNGCAPIDSIFPLYKDGDAAFDDHLLGSWQPVITDANASDKDVRWIFSHSEGDQFYGFKWGAVGVKGGFIAEVHLVRLGNDLFVDFEGDSQKLDDTPNSDNVVPYPMITTHMIGRIWLEKDSLVIHFLGDDWVKKQVKSGTFSLAHLDINGGQILTAQTEDLRKFMQAHADDKEALSEEFKLTRAK